MYRQGDVLIVPMTAQIDDNFVAQDKTVLAYGEVTGHAHVLESPQLRVKTRKEGTRDVAEFIRLAERGLLRHEEHSPIELPAGDYQVIRQREYSPAELRNVAD